MTCNHIQNIYSLRMLDKIYGGDRSQATHDILDTLDTQGYCIVNFLYFANAMKWRLFESPRHVKDITYKQSLLDGDYLLPDGIALQMFYGYYRDTRLANLNGTDFVPYLLDQLINTPKISSLSIYLYQCYDPAKGKTAESLQSGLEALQEMCPTASFPRSGQCLFSRRGEEFDREGLTGTVREDPSEIKVFLHCTGTPYQEMWVQEYREFFQTHGFLVLNAGGLIDYLTGFETRAPDWVVRARVLETFWRITKHPKKNLHKFLSMFGVFRFLFTNKSL